MKELLYYSIATIHTAQLRKLWGTLLIGLDYIITYINQIKRKSIMFRTFSSKNISLSVIYDVEDRSIKSLPMSKLRSGLLVSINYLQLELAKNGVVVGLNGYCPHGQWIYKELKFPVCQELELYYAEINQLDFGSVPRLNDEKWWPVYYDAFNGILCLDSGEISTEIAQILPGVALEINNLGVPKRFWCKLNNTSEINKALAISF